MEVWDFSRNPEGWGPLLETTTSIRGGIFPCYFNLHRWRKLIEIKRNWPIAEGDLCTPGDGTSLWGGEAHHRTPGPFPHSPPRRDRGTSGWSSGWWWAWPPWPRAAGGCRTGAAATTPGRRRTAAHRSVLGAAGVWAISPLFTVSGLNLKVFPSSFLRNARGTGGKMHDGGGMNKIESLLLAPAGLIFCDGQMDEAEFLYEN